jgi:diadenosine tetraphosphate (Ap4A) HIT family hydrolase
MGANGRITVMVRKTDCIFCNPDRAILAETDLSLAFLDSFPVSHGHTLVIPKRHIETIWDMTNKEYADVFDLIKKVKDILKAKFDPDGFNVGVNCGEAAGQTVFHAHVHIVPRYVGDAPYARSLPFIAGAMMPLSQTAWRLVGGP